MTDRRVWAKAIVAIPKEYTIEDILKECNAVALHESIAQHHEFWNLSIQGDGETALYYADCPEDESEEYGSIENILPTDEDCWLVFNPGDDEFISVDEIDSKEYQNYLVEAATYRNKKDWGSTLQPFESETGYFGIEEE